MGRLNMFKREGEVIPMFVKRYEQVTGSTFRDSLFNLVICDSFNLAGDNGEYFYRRVREIDPDIRMTFLISRGSRDCSRLLKDGFNIYPFEGDKLEFILNNASYILFSKDMGPNLDAKDALCRHKDKTIFLQHGMTSRIYNDDFYFSQILNNYTEFSCCASEVERELLNIYSKGKIQPILCGFPRHDILLRKHQSSRNPGKKSVFCEFHWRPDIKTRSDMMKSQYRSDINAILNSPQARMMQESGVKLYFLPHAKYMHLLECFNIPNWITVPSDRPFQDILVDSDILVTDFSSNSFEMAYMDKLTVGYVPGLQDVLKRNRRYNIEQLKRCEHITYCNDRELVFDKVAWFLRHNEKMDGMSRRLFKWVDTDNSERLLNWLLERYRNG